ncbi:NAD(P)-dependent oxidoreductase, partial [Acinetobacter baumannii]
RALPLAQEYRVAGFPAVRGRRGRFGLRIGVVGASASGRGVIQRLVADGWDVAGYDPVVDPALVQALGARQLELDELCAHSDILTLHAPSLP